MNLFHGTNKLSKENILQNGFVINENNVNGKLLGNGIYFTNRVERAKVFGKSIIKAEIDMDNIKILYFEEWIDFYNSINPFRDINEVAAGEMVKAYFVKQGHNGLSIETIDGITYETVIYDPSIIKSYI